MPAELPELVGDAVLLVPVRRGTATAVLGGGLGGRSAGPGWPHEDSAHALAFADAGGATWLVVDAHGTVVGEAGIKTAPDPDGVVEIGYGLAGPSRGVGLGTRAVATLLAWLSARPDVRVVTARVAMGNMPSRRLLERLGFVAGEVEAGEVHYRWRTDRAIK